MAKFVCFISVTLRQDKFLVSSVTCLIKSFSFNVLIVIGFIDFDTLQSLSQAV